MSLPKQQISIKNNSQENKNVEIEKSDNFFNQWAGSSN